MNQDISRFSLEKDKTVLLVVDVQERLIPTMSEMVYQKTLKNIQFLVEAAEHLKVPVVATEQYPKGLGPTVSELTEACKSKVIEKVSFGCCGEPSFLDYMTDLDRPQVIVAGMEAHVCVYQTVLGLLEGGYSVHLVRDAIISRSKLDYQNALELAAQAGATVTTAETVLFQLMGTSAAPEFKAISNLIKNR